MNASSARDLLSRAARERERVTRHLLVAAAIASIFDEEPVVVGGTAEEYWTGDEYHPTDLDLCAPVGAVERGRLRALGFAREGRHWIHPDVEVAVEFPDSRIDGTLERTVRETRTGEGARVIGVDDLYVDRLRQAAVNEEAEAREFHSALAVATACYRLLDRKYLSGRLREIARSEPQTAASMKRLDSKIMRRARRVLAEER